MNFAKINILNSRLTADIRHDILTFSRRHLHPAHHHGQNRSQADTDTRPTRQFAYKFNTKVTVWTSYREIELNRSTRNTFYKITNFMTPKPLQVIMHLTVTNAATI